MSNEQTFMIGDDEARDEARTEAFGERMCEEMRELLDGMSVVCEGGSACPGETQNTIDTLMDDALSLADDFATRIEDGRAFVGMYEMISDERGWADIARQLNSFRLCIGQMARQLDGTPASQLIADEAMRAVSIFNAIGTTLEALASVRTRRRAS